MPRTATLRRLRGIVRSGTCSTKVRFVQSMFRQVSRRTCNTIHTGRPLIGASRKRRW
jgi:hypothetical protein